MIELVIASNNKGKIRELTELLNGISLLSLKDIGFLDEIEEPFDQFDQNARAKADTIHSFSGKNVMAEDSGLCVAALGGAPGVHSARYAGSPQDEQRNLEKLMQRMEGEQDRKAFYKAVICLIWDGKEHFFEGICNGQIATKSRGDGGFGYDPIFIPDGFNETFAEISPEVKNQISHRGKAIAQMLDFLNQL